MKDQVTAHLQTQGLAGGMMVVDRLPELRAELLKWHEDKMMDDELFGEYLSRFDFDHRRLLPEARSVITVAVPDPQTKIVFTWHKGTHPFMVPPTYLHWEKVNRKAEDVLGRLLANSGYRLVPVKLPLKLAAARSGVGQYGRNNIFYVPNRGSFHRLACFLSDAPCGEDCTWNQLVHLPRCEKCDLCVKSCPTGAIDPTRFLIKAERCITFLNEKSGDIPFPSWLNPAWHNCLVGCLICQKVCPENKNYLQQIRTGVTFTQKETELLVSTPLPEALPAELEEKLKESDLLGILDIIPRNLRALLGIA